jgi:hypothetical protein
MRKLLVLAGLGAGLFMAWKKWLGGRKEEGEEAGSAAAEAAPPAEQPASSA